MPKTSEKQSSAPSNLEWRSSPPKPCKPFPADVPISTIERFWSKVKLSSNLLDECWEWIGNKRPNGYGIFFIGHSDQWSAHRFAYHLANGDPGELIIRHKCDNRGCVNPTHLETGTMIDNVKDMLERGNSHAKLNIVSVNEIRAKYAQGTTDKQLALSYGVSKRTIYDIITYRTWSKNG